MKVCRVCETPKPLTEFGKYAREKDGHATQCIECKREYDNNWTKSNNESSRVRNKKWRDKRRRLIYRYKRAKGCLCCDENESVALDFHHKNPDEKDINIGLKAGAWAKERIKVELFKCVVVCGNCHRKIHAGLLTI